MKRLLIIPFIFLACALHAQTVIPQPAGGKPSWATIADQDFTLRYPPNWTLDQSGLLGSNFFLFAPLDAGRDTFRENFNLIINDLSEYPGISLAEMAEGARQQITNMVDSVKVLEFKEMEDGFDKYYLVEYSGRQNKFNLHWRQHYWLAHNKFYVLTFTAEEHQDARYLPLAQLVLSSFYLK